MTVFMQMAKEYLQQNANAKGQYVDFTMGRGKDTLFLCGLAPLGRVLAFDIQAEALSDTDVLLKQHLVNNATLILDSHENFENYVSGLIDGGMFNLGFLPGGSRNLTTRRESTLFAVTRALERLKSKGRLSITIYPGHFEGEAEGEMLLKLAARLDKGKFEARVFRLLNVPEAPFTLMFEKR